MAADADAFVDVYRPGVAERLGIGPDALRQRNPRLVYARMTGYGQDGPLAGHAGHDINYIALTGALHGIGTAESPIPPLNLVGDYGGGGMLLAVGLLSAILEARESGEGQVLDVAMIDGVATLLAPYFGMVPAGTWRDHRQDNLLDGAAHFYGVYATADGTPHRGRRNGTEVLRRALRSPRRRRAARRRQAGGLGRPPRRAGRTLRREVARRVGADPGFPGMLCDTGAFAHRGAAASAPGCAADISSIVDGITAARTGAALLADRARRALIAVVARRPHRARCCASWDWTTDAITELVECRCGAHRATKGYDRCRGTSPPTRNGRSNSSGSRISCAPSASRST